MKHFPRASRDGSDLFATLSTWALVRRACLYLWRALRLRCPECGVSPVFVPAWRTRSVRDWFTPLDGCPRCGYAYEREDGYFLLANWGVHYFTVTAVGLAAALLVDHFFAPPFAVLAWGVSVPTLAFGFWFARYAKSIYLAIDHFFDPHVKPSPE
jgi:uncharacterized protein (DUF983 family)